MVKMMAKGRVNQVLIGEIVGRYFKSYFKNHDFTLGREIGRVPVSFRVHQSKKELVARLNKGIRAMKANGEIRRVLKDSS